MSFAVFRKYQKPLLWVTVIFCVLIFATFSGFDDLWDAYRTQVEYLASLNMLAAGIAGTVQKRRGHCPLMSSLLGDCLESRRDLVHGATRYNLPGVSVLGNIYVRRIACGVLCGEKQRVCARVAASGPFRGLCR